MSFDPADSPSRDTEMRPKLFRCDRAGCGEQETTAGEFFTCPTCGETLCNVHSVRVSQWGGAYECEPCFLKHEAPERCANCEGHGWDKRTDNDCSDCNGTGVYMTPEERRALWAAYDAKRKQEAK